MIVPPIDKAQVTGLGTSDSRQFTGVNIGHASDTTIGRSAAGVLGIEGVAVLGGGEATVASNTTCDIGAVISEHVSITGTTTITGFGTVAAGTKRQGRFTGALTLTHNATSLILPGGANITTAAGDRFGAVSLGSGNWAVYWFTKADGTPVVGGGGGANTVLTCIPPNTAVTMTNQGSTRVFLGVDSRHLYKADLSQATACRFIVRVATASTSVNTPQLVLLYKTGAFSTTIGDYSDIGTSTVYASLAATGLIDSGWINLAAGAKADNVFVAFAQEGGDSDKDPVVQLVCAMFK